MSREGDCAAKGASEGTAELVDAGTEKVIVQRRARLKVPRSNGCWNREGDYAVKGASQGDAEKWMLEQRR